MKVKTLINLLSSRNLDADIVFKTDPTRKGMVVVSTKAKCKCSEKEISLTIGTKE